MMDFSFVARGFVLFPLQDKSEAFPPPTSMTLLAIGPNSPFLADFLPPVELNLLILFCCTKKFVILCCTIFKSFTAVSKQVEFTALEQASLPLPPCCTEPDFLGFLPLLVCFLFVFLCFPAFLFFCPNFLAFLPPFSAFLRPIFFPFLPVFLDFLPLPFLFFFGSASLFTLDSSRLSSSSSWSSSRLSSSVSLNVSSFSFV